MTSKRLFRVRLSGRGGPLFRAAAEQIVGREQLCLKSQKSILDTVSTTCDSGWVDDQYAKFLLILNPNDLPTRYRRWY
jgi:hypothetical protein